ncbi:MULTISPECIES: malto-oligosyltrehalose trehalohydrolase [Stutzerimonas stutzeri subgroup]|jgi:maltooligosyltrehalose trehalohydrolase|uniref:Malto-oligosyltrehalose trehalohydrolase n=1 Tax=Stutzerimonas stutzeri NF13 TaxID=1212548 RepID=M2TSV7_STUST|nr:MULTISPECIES: malto-oligosyltrehalose trehalohydrolase [Stutzerimonas stutzeri subgroup]EME00391.1 alpha-amylase family protein [Stutzerimonas stutzeri NF13]MBK3882897.1 malto-oligosyltrehalose trehalohydrolase [Stutzerimonas stutzeri]MCQ4290374.1 malto-oligosyltrehalose trehalohydrolase [Stutzerimonas stutzeri]WOF79208.1 malto-oligosyltrehalose trehalohydrolase [Pseudomonas sp. FeN3W]
MQKQRAHIGHHGPELLEDGTTRFRLWAPDAQNVSLIVVGAQTLPMTAIEEGWYSIDAPYGTGTLYRFLIDDELHVPDPASRAQAGDVHAPSLVVDTHNNYLWRNGKWLGRPWHETVLYETHVGLYGGFAAMEEHLAGLAELGVTAIELMPIAEFPGDRNWGYDGVLPYAPEAAYGSPEELKHLIDTAHGLGLMVFLDVVYNHFGPDGNYLGRYAKHFFRHDQQTPWGDGIDFRRREVRDFFIDNALMWLMDYRFDGLRFDAVHAIPDRSFLTELAERVHATVEPGRHVHLVLENEDNRSSLLTQGFTAQWNDDGHNVLHALLTDESQGYYADYHQGATAKLARFLGEGFIYQGQNNRRGEARGEPSAHLSPTSFVLFLQNHDQTGNRAFGDRLVTLADADALRAATAVLLLSPMVPLLFMGEEWGSRQPFLFFTSHHGELADAVREGRRNEFAEFSEFADEATRERIPDPNAVSTFEQSRPDFGAQTQSGHAEWHALYRQLLSIRHAEIVPRLPGSVFLGCSVLGDAAVLARWQLGDGSQLRLELNLGERAAPLPASSTTAQLLFASREWDANTPDQLPPRMAKLYLEKAK